MLPAIIVISFYPLHHSWRRKQTRSPKHWVSIPKWACRPRRVHHDYIVIFGFSETQIIIKLSELSGNTQYSAFHRRYHFDLELSLAVWDIRNCLFYYISPPSFTLVRKLPTKNEQCANFSNLSEKGFGFLTFKDMRVFENRMLRRIFAPKTKEVREGWRQLRKEELHDG